MTKRNSSHRRNRKKEQLKKKNPPVGMITMGVGIVLIGLAALLMLPKADSVVSAPEEYSSIPMEVSYDAPELELENLAGEPESLEDYRGQVVLVNLWATWCPPCKAELPVLQEYYEDHLAEGFVILGIDSQEKPEKVEEYIATTDVSYPIWIDEHGDAGLAFSSYSLPASFVIDREGTVRLAWTGAISKPMLEEHVTLIIEE
ncbi:MAG: TlpA family protein disulfide reductase [Anaerolineae bacterium]|jgi:thiol-disulfide isomerase/thioredoxin|nr:TlpA family protein disulfide reductase [Anaerolineae bacterium]MBT4310007.1 TlpA family protein disulfide reductase [Anaerolineae bacterium]MBT4458015.1 TlpA family protein disulfide reductase [Anaerolineae bacterium]MBT6060866.1 TlpA family protein disulfide reductase [Anaerolineae bacterium]MBT6322205.1 TlpA family protein disulfide reductase [Anaerolineae bacterium]